MTHRLLRAFVIAALVPLRVCLAQVTVSSQSHLQPSRPVAPDFPTFTTLGPSALIMPVVKQFGVNPVAIDTTNGYRVSLIYVDGPYTRLTAKQQAAQAVKIARFVWRIPGRPINTDTLSVSFARPMRTMGETGVKTEWLFSKEVFTTK